MLYRGHVPVWIVVLLLLASCGGGGTDLAGELAPANDTPKEFSLSVLEESFLEGSSAQISLDLDQSSDIVTARILVDNAIDLRAAYVELDYDELRFSPLQSSADGLLAGSDELISLALTDTPGRVAYGEVLRQPDDAVGFNGDGTLVEFSFERRPFVQTRSAATAPHDNGSATTLEFTDATNTFWYYYSTGDYDQNGTTSIADLTPLGRHFGEQGPFDEATIQGVVDYDDNNLINISDITGIGIGFGNSVSEYRMYESTDPDNEYPSSNDEDPLLDALATTPFSAAIGDKSKDRLSFSLALDEITPGAGYWVRPGDDDGDGTPSNLINFDDIPDFSLTFYQVDHTLDEDIQVDSEFGQVEIEFTGKADPEYFNLNVNGEWVIQNVPILPVEGEGATQSVFLDFPLPIEPGTELLEIEYGATLTSETKTEAPPQKLSLGILSLAVRILNGQDLLTALTSGEVQNEIGTEVDGSNWAVHGTMFPNQEAKTNECVPAGIANSLKFLKDSNPTEMEDVDDADISSDAIGGAVDYTAGGGTPGKGGKATWPGKKAQYMREKMIPVSTTSVPADQSFSGEATAEECDTAIQAIKDGKDVELQGRGHVAAIVGMAKLTNGKYVMYVAHDTNQGAEGGQQVQKIIYDPSADNPVAEGGWGFNGRNIFGFVIESVDDEQDEDISFTQDNVFIDEFTQLDSEHGLVNFTYEQTADPMLYLNLNLGGEHQIQDLPLRSGEAGTTGTVSIPVSFLVGEGNDVVDITAGWTLGDAPLATDPGEALLFDVVDSDFKVDSGEDGTPLQYTGVTTDPTWFIGHDFTDAAFHPTSAIVNQECGSNECAPAAISNSLKTLQKLNPTQNQDLDVDIDTIKPATGWSATGAPAGVPGNENAWWNRKKKWMNDNKDYPVQTDIVSDKSKFDDIIQAIKDGKDVELRVPGHVVMVTGIIKLANGQYILEIVHDSNQSDDTKGTQTELIKYDPETNTFSGRGWINGKKFTEGDDNGCLFVVESFSNLNINRLNITSGSTTVDLSGYGELDLVIEDEADVQYLNLVLEDEWVIQNLPMPGTTTIPITLTPGFTFPDITIGEDKPSTVYVHTVSKTPVETIPTAPVEESLIDPIDWSVESGESAVNLLAPTLPLVPLVNWLPFGIADIACHNENNIVNQEAGENECAPAAISNSLKLLQNQHQVGMAGLDIDIDDMKPATGWGAGGAPAGTPEADGAWWNLKAKYMIDNGYPVTTQVKTKDKFGEIINDIRNGKDVEMRVPGHVVMVTCVIVLANGDMIFWVAHDTDQGDDTKGTKIEPIYYDESEGTFHGNFWVEGKTAATPGNAGVLFVVEDYLDLLVPVPLCVDPFALVPLGPPGLIPDGFSGTAPLLHRESLQPLGSIDFVLFDPDNGHMSWQPGPGGAPLIVFDNLEGTNVLGIQFFGESMEWQIPGYSPRLVSGELLLRNTFVGSGTDPAGNCQITLADFTPVAQFPLGPATVPPTGPPLPFGVVLDNPLLPFDFFMGTFQQPDSYLELEGVYMDFLPQIIEN